MDSFDLRKIIRESSGEGIGQIDTSVVSLNVSIDVGSTWYALEADPEVVKSAFEANFSDFSMKREFCMHSQVAGTTIELVITGLAIGGGIVATEFLKGFGKSLWQSIDALLFKEKETSKPPGQVGDKVRLTLEIDNERFQASITIGTESNQEALLRSFFEDAALDLYTKASETKAKNAPLSERLAAYKASKEAKND